MSVVTNLVLETAERCLCCSEPVSNLHPRCVRCALLMGPTAQLDMMRMTPMTIDVKVDVSEACL